MIFSTLLFLFIFMPILEIMILIRVHDSLGFIMTFGLVVFTGCLGAFLARMQGLMVMRQIQEDLQAGHMPAPRLMDGMMILIAGVLLITPGLITDLVGFSLLVPPVRYAIRLWLRNRLEKKILEGRNVTIWRM